MKIKQKLFWVSEVVLLIVALSASTFVWFTQAYFSSSYSPWVVWIVQPGVLLVMLSAINWAWTWNRQWKDFYW